MLCHSLFYCMDNLVMCIFFSRDHKSSSKSHHKSSHSHGSSSKDHHKDRHGDKRKHGSSSSSKHHHKSAKKSRRWILESYQARINFSWGTSLKEVRFFCDFWRYLPLPMSYIQSIYVLCPIFLDTPWHILPTT